MAAGGGFGFEDNWGLQAVVRGNTSTSQAADCCFFDGGGNDDWFLGGVPDDDDHHMINTFQINNCNINDDLQEFYKPFYPPTAAGAAAIFGQDDDIDHSIPQLEKEGYYHQHYPNLPQSSDATTTTAPPTTAAQTPKYRKRKNQNKRVVMQAAAAGAEGLPSDMWAWRKYGQKPIKGSPFPRSYYRCSSSKGCLARKQVEQSCTEPGVFLISYAAEHNHAQPIRKNALAGTTRQKFPPPPLPASTSTQQITPAWTTKSNKENSNWCAAAPISPISSITTGDQSAFEDHGCSSMKQHQEINKEDYNVKMEEEFFAGLEDLDGLISELASGQHQYSSTKMLSSINFYS